MKYEAPEALKNLVDLKAITINSFQVAIDGFKKSDKITLGKDTKLILLTQASLIECELLNENEKEPIYLINKMALEARNKLLSTEEYTNKNYLNQSATLRLKNVTITPFSNPQAKINLPVLNLFTDQILGVSFGSYSQK